MSGWGGPGCLKKMMIAGQGGGEESVRIHTQPPWRFGRRLPTTRQRRNTCWSRLVPGRGGAGIWQIPPDPIVHVHLRAT